ncbi:MAG: RNA polymerase sigma factor [Bacteroidota bacterium]
MFNFLIYRLSVFFDVFFYFCSLYYLRISVEDIKEIVKGCIKGNRAMQSRLYKMFASQMYALCLRYTRNDFDAQDVLQEGFVKIFNNLKDFQWKGSLEGWMKRIFIRLALDRFRNKIQILSVDEIPEKDNFSEKDSNAIDQMSAKEILYIVQELPDQYRLVFNLYVLEGYSHNEISQILNIGVSTSRSNLVRAKNILKEKIVYNAHWIDKAI